MRRDFDVASFLILIFADKHRRLCAADVAAELLHTTLRCKSRRVDALQVLKRYTALPQKRLPAINRRGYRRVVTFASELEISFRQSREGNACLILGIALRHKFAVTKPSTTRFLEALFESL